MPRPHAGRHGSFEGDKMAFGEELSSPSTWYLVDAKTPTSVEAITVQTSSPDPAEVHVSTKL